MSSVQKLERSFYILKTLSEPILIFSLQIMISYGHTGLCSSQNIKYIKKKRCHNQENYMYSHTRLLF